MSMLAIKRFICNAWLAATPLVIVLALVGALAAVAIVGQIIARVAGGEASDNFIANVGTLFGMLVLFAPLAIVVYALISIARWLLARR
jgi:hypothetical protein